MHCSAVVESLCAFECFDLEAQDSLGMTPLMKALNHNNTAVVRLFLALNCSTKTTVGGDISSSAHTKIAEIACLLLEHANKSVSNAFLVSFQTGRRVSRGFLVRNLSESRRDSKRRHEFVINCQFV